MNTTPILTAAALLVASVPAYSQDDPFGEPKPPVQPPPPVASADPFGGPDHPPTHHPEDPFAPKPPKPHDEALLQRIDVEFEEVPLPVAIQYLQEHSDKPLNFVVRPPADEVIVPRMRVRDVSIETVLEVIEGLTPIHVSTIRGNDHGAPVIVIQADPRQANPRKPATAVRPLAEGSMFAPVINPRATPPPFTRAYAVREILETVELESLIDLIREFWSRSEPDWAKQSGAKAIALHEATGMLIVKAPEPRQEEIRSLLDGLENTIKAAQPDPEMLKMKGRLIELEHRAELAVRSAEEQRARSKDTEAKLREVLGQREQEITELRRTIAELKDSLERAKARQ